MNLDADLQAIQDVRDQLREANAAQQQLEKMTQAQIDRIVASMARAAEADAERLAVLAVEETGYGTIHDKKAKNMFVANNVYDAIKDMMTVGIIRKDEAKQVWEIAQPVGVIAAIVPSTNPTSTVMFKCMISIKARNAIVISPHPAALQCSQEAAASMRRAAEQAGAPKGLIHILSKPSLDATQELMKHKLTNLVLATGGTAMVKAAYSSGKPAYGVGPGNVPVYVHRSAKIPEAVQHILHSKTFDYGTICASEQAIVVDQAVKPALVAELQRQGAYFVQGDDKAKVAAALMNGSSLNPAIVGKSPQVIADIAGIRIPHDAKLLIAEESRVGLDYPFSIEKLSPVLALYTVNDWQEGCRRCIELLELGGLGHTVGIHCEDPNIIEAFGLEKPASRIVVNSGTTFGGIGATTGMMPSLTLGCGSFGNNITSDNMSPMHLLNIKRVAFGIRPFRSETKSETGRDVHVAAAHRALEAVPSGANLGISREEVLEIVKRVLQQHSLQMEDD